MHVAVTKPICAAIRATTVFMLAAGIEDNESYLDRSESGELRLKRVL